MDDYDVMERARLDFKSLWKDKNQVIIDEAQRLPGLFNAIKTAFDTDRKKRFILSGSSNLLLMEGVTESLAGRALYFDLLPLTHGEAEGKLWWWLDR